MISSVRRSGENQARNLHYRLGNNFDGADWSGCRFALRATTMVILTNPAMSRSAAVDDGRYDTVRDSYWIFAGNTDLGDGRDPA